MVDSDESVLKLELRLEIITGALLVTEIRDDWMIEAVLVIEVDPPLTLVSVVGSDETVLGDELNAVPVESALLSVETEAVCETMEAVPVAGVEISLILASVGESDDKVLENKLRTETVEEAPPVIESEPV